MLRLLLISLLAPAAFAGHAITLEQAYDKALDSDQSIAIALISAQRAALEPRSALARLAPRLNAAVAALGSDHTGDRTSGGTNSARTSLTFEKPLIDQSVAPAYRRGLIATRAARLQHRASIRDTLFAVAAAYYDVLQQQRVITVDQQSLELAQKNQALAAKRTQAGAVTRTDLLRADAAVLESQRALIESQAGLTVKRNVLLNILNLGADNGFTLVEPSAVAASSVTMEALVARALAQRESLQAIQLIIDQQRERRAEVEGSYKPRITSQVTAASSGASQSRSNGELQASVNVQIPIFTGGQKAIDLSAVDLAIREAEQSYKLQREGVQHETVDAWVTANALAQTVVALQAQVVAAEQSYTQIQRQYEEGVAKAIDVLDALRTLNATRRDLAVQTFAREVSLLRLDYVSGVFQQARVTKTPAP
jgi:outer membrane protein